MISSGGCKKLFVHYGNWNLTHQRKEIIAQTHWKAKEKKSFHHKAYRVQPTCKDTDTTEHECHTYFFLWPTYTQICNNMQRSLRGLFTPLMEQILIRQTRSWETLSSETESEIEEIQRSKQRTAANQDWIGIQTKNWKQNISADVSRKAQTRPWPNNSSFGIFKN